MNSSLSFSTSANSKGFIKDTVVPFVKQALPVADKYLGVGCKVGTVVSFVAPFTAPVTGGVCVASRVTSVANGFVNRK
jgi:hypothetical protein